MNGRLMKMELDGNINNKENIEEISKKEIGNGRIAEPRVSTSLVRLQHGGSGKDCFDE